MIGHTASDAVVALERVVAVDREPPRRMHDVVVAPLDDRRRARFTVAVRRVGHLDGRGLEGRPVRKSKFESTRHLVDCHTVAGGVTARTGSGSTLLASGGSRTNCSLESESVSWLMTAASPRASRPSKASSSRRRGGERERGERMVRPVALARHDPPLLLPWRFLRGLLRSAIRSELRISFSPETTLVTIEPGLFWSAVRAPDLFNLRGIFSCHPALRVRKGVRRDSAALESV